MKTVRWTSGVAVLALALTLTTAAAFAASPRSEVTVSGAQLTLGDVFDGVTENAGHVLAPAPAPGRPLTLSVSDLERISTAFDLGWKAVDGSEKTVVRAVATELDRTTVEAAVAGALSERYPERHFDLSFAVSSFPVVLQGRFSGEPEVARLDFDPGRGFFTAELEVAPKNGGTPATIKVAGRADQMIEVPVLTENLREGAVISDADVTLVRRRAADLGQGVVLDKTQMLGRAPRRGVIAGRPLQEADLVDPKIVAKGEAVTVILKKGRLSLSVRGKALEAGADGQTIRVLNPSSNKVVDATVTGPQTVTVVM